MLPWPVPATTHHHHTNMLARGHLAAFKHPRTTTTLPPVFNPLRPSSNCRRLHPLHCEFPARHSKRAVKLYTLTVLVKPRDPQPAWFNSVVRPLSTNSIEHEESRARTINCFIIPSRRASIPWTLIDSRLLYQVPLLRSKFDCSRSEGRFLHQPDFIATTVASAETTIFALR